MALVQQRTLVFSLVVVARLVRDAAPTSARQGREGNAVNCEEKAGGAGGILFTITYLCAYAQTARWSPPSHEPAFPVSNKTVLE